MPRTDFRRLSLLLGACLIPWLASGDEEPPPFIHPGMLQSRADLDFMKQKVAAAEEPWKSAWEFLLRQSESSLEFKPQPFARVIRGPYGNPNIGGNELAISARAAHSHALQWVVTGNKRHADKVIEILAAWSPVLASFHENDAKLLAGWTGHAFCNAAEIIRWSNAGWPEKDVEAFKRMLLQVYYPLIADFFPEANGNWDAAIIDTMLCIGIFCDDRAIFDRAVNQFLRGPINAGITHYVYPSGQCQESTRDQRTCSSAWGNTRRPVKSLGPRESTSSARPTTGLRRGSSTRRGSWPAKRFPRREGSSQGGREDSVRFTTGFISIIAS